MLTIWVSGSPVGRSLPLLGTDGSLSPSAFGWKTAELTDAKAGIAEESEGKPSIGSLVEGPLWGAAAPRLVPSPASMFVRCDAPVSNNLLKANRSNTRCRAQIAIGTHRETR